MLMEWFPKLENLDPSDHESASHLTSSPFIEMNEMKMCKVHKIEIDGFKVFKDKQSIGPFRSLTCIIGPNGCGKSCLVEAVAFALSGKSNLLQTQTLQSLINRDRLKNGNQSAQVTLVMNCSNSEVEDLIHIKRSIIKSKTKLEVKSGLSQWQLKTQEALKRMLLEFNIHVEAIERYIVMQSRQAMNVANPVALLTLLESCLGSQYIQEQIATSNKAKQLHLETCEHLLTEIQKFEMMREENSPIVQKFEEYRRKKEEIDQNWKELMQAHVLHLCKGLITDQEKIQLNEQKLNRLQQNQKETTKKLNSIQKELQTVQVKSQEAQMQYISTKEECEKLRLELCRKRAKQRILHTRLQEFGQETDVQELKCKEYELHKELQVYNIQMQQLDLGLEQKQKALKEMDLQEQKHGCNENFRLHIHQKDAAIKALEWKLQGAEQILTSKKEASSRLQENILKLEAELEADREEERSKETEIEQLEFVLRSKQKELDHYQSHARILEHKHIDESIPAKEVSKSGMLQFYQKYDKAVSQLFSKGNVIGRLCNVISLKNAEFDVAVNAALCQMLSLQSFLLVPTSDKAKTVIQYFRENRIGMVTCSIIHETLQSCSATSVHTNSLLDLVNIKETQFQSLVQRLLGNWLLVESPEEATKIIMNQKPKDRKHNYVTRAGEIFLANGTVKKFKTPTSELSKYFIKTEFQSLDTDLPSNTVHDTHIGQVSLENRNRNRPSIENTIREQKNEVLEIRNKIGEIRESLFHQETVIYKLKTSREQIKKKIESQSNTLFDLKQRDHSIKQESEKLQINTLAKELKIIKDEYKEFRLQYEGDDTRLNLEQELEHLSLDKNLVLEQQTQLELSLGETAQNLKDLALQLQQREEISQKLKTLEAEVASLEESFSQLEQLLVTYEEAQLEVKNKALSVSRKLNHHTKRCQQIDNDICQEKRTACQLNTDIGSMLDTLDGGINTIKQDFQDSTHVEMLREYFQNRQSSDLRQLPEMIGLLENVIAAFQNMKKKTVYAKDLDFEYEFLMIEAKREQLEKLRLTINPDVLRSDLEDARSIQELQFQHQKQSELAQHESQKLNELEKQRMQLLKDGITTINNRLESIYMQLTNQEGTATLVCLSNSNALLEQGVEFHCRPNHACHGSGTFSFLSVGQQCLATLALSFAIQDAFPSPFYFFDEMDCALDKVAATKVIQYIKEQQNAQYFIISHKAHVFEKAECLIGVFGACEDISVLLLDCVEHGIE